MAKRVLEHRSEQQADACSEDHPGPHFTLDVALHEDDHPWIEADPKGALVLALLRRVAYNLLTLFRSVTLRGGLSRIAPWKTVLSWCAGFRPGGFGRPGMRQGQ